MEFTFKGKRMDKVMICANGAESNPYKSVEQVGFSLGEPPINDADRLTFIEENYLILIALCAEMHQGWLEENVPTVIH
jgi:hypothetical protein